MTLTEALSQLDEAGAKITVEDGELILDVPPDQTITPDVIKVLSKNRDKLITEIKPRSDSDQDSSFAWIDQAAVDSFKVWDGETMGDTIAMDTETELIDQDHKEKIPALALTVVWDGVIGFFVESDDLDRFLTQHNTNQFVFHNGAGFDVHVIDNHTHPYDLLSGHGHKMLVENRLIDTMIMERLIELGTTGMGADSSPKEFNLQAVTKHYTGHELSKDKDIRETFGPYVGKSVTTIPKHHLDYAAMDVVATLLVYQSQVEEIAKIKSSARKAFGFVSDEHLDQACEKYGPLTHHLQAKTFALCAVMERNGLHVDQSRTAAVLESVQTKYDTAAKVLKDAGIPVGGEAGHNKAMDKYLFDLEAKVGGTFPKTATGKHQTTEKAIKQILTQTDDKVLNHYGAYKGAIKDSGSYVKKFSKPWLHPRWNALLVTGRTSCSGELAAQTLPRDSGRDTGKYKIKQCVVPKKSHSLLGFDVSGAEMATLGVVLRDQMGFGDHLAKILEAGLDAHLATAHDMVGDRFGPVTKMERQMAKAANFGIPGGLGNPRLIEYAKDTYGVMMSEDDVKRVRSGYGQMNPAILPYLNEKSNIGDDIKDAFSLTSRNMGWILYKAAKGTKQSVHPNLLSTAWAKMKTMPLAQYFGEKKVKRILDDIENRKSSEDLLWAVELTANKTSALSMTGRLRAKTTYCQTRNCLFQALAADAALVALWELYCSGFQPVGFIHDEIILEVPDKDANKTTVEDVLSISTKAMATVLNGFEVGLDPFVRKSLSPRDETDWAHVEELPPPDFFCRPKPKPEPPPQIVDGQIMNFTVPESKPRKRRDQANTRGRKQAKNSAEFLF
jgi:DNA polymerase I-like protein with 3'-5' exonuclease and polymerase domains